MEGVYDSMLATTVGGAKYAKANRSVDDDKMVTVVAGFDSLDTLNGFVGHPRIEDASQRAGVIGEPRIEIYEEVGVI